jgi:hypothetical protein
LVVPTATFWRALVEVAGVHTWQPPLDSWFCVYSVPPT